MQELSTMGEKSVELEYKGKIKPDCDWIIGFFKPVCAAEMNGLLTANEYLAGALLQKSKFNDEAA